MKPFIWLILNILFLLSTAQAASFNKPMGIATDRAGNIYVTEGRKHHIRKINPAGIVTTLAGRADVRGDTDGIGAAARFYDPSGLVTDSAGNLYVADSTNHTIRKITPAGVVTTLAGLAYVRGHTDGTGSAARFSQPADVAVDKSGSVYVADRSNYTIRKTTSAGVVTTFAGRAQDNSDPTDGTGELARFSAPFGIATDSAGNVYAVETFTHTIRKITPAGVVTTLAGAANKKGYANGRGVTARFNEPYGIAVDGDGNLYVADSRNAIIRKITSAGMVTTLAGAAGKKGYTDGIGVAARFNQPVDVATDSAGNVYVADTGNNAIRKITPAGAVTTLTVREGADANDGAPDDVGGAKAADYIGRRIYGDSDEYKNSSGFLAVDKRLHLPKTSNNPADIGKHLIVQLIYKHGRDVVVFAEPHMTGPTWDWMLVHDAIDIPQGQQFIGVEPECLAEKYPWDTVFATGTVATRIEPNGMLIAQAKSISKAWILDYDVMKLKEIPTNGVKCELRDFRN